MEYFYKARDNQGNQIESSLEADSEDAAKISLFEMGLFVTEISKTKNANLIKSVKDSITSIFQGVKLEELLIFNQQFRIIYQIGYPIIDGLQLIAKQMPNLFFKDVITRVAEDIANGTRMSDALEKFPDIFDNTYINLIRSGESSGKIDEILGKISLLTEKKSENKQKVKSALFYPKIVIVVMVGVFCIVSFFVIPKFKKFYGRFQGALPLPTRIVVFVSDFMLNYWYLAFGLTGFAYWLFQKYAKSPTGMRQLNKFVLKTPIFGNLVTLIETSTFCTVLQLLLSGGVPVVQSMTLVKDALSNYVFRAETQKFIEDVKNGKKLTNQLQNSDVFPALTASLIGIGEETGELEVVLEKISSYYEMQINYKLDNLSKTIEPILLALIMGMVLLIALAVFMPMWKMNELMTKDK